MEDQNFQNIDFSHDLNNTMNMNDQIFVSGDMHGVYDQTLFTGSIN